MIFFHTQETAFVLKKKAAVKSWISKTIRDRGKRTGELNFIFCSDEHLLKINIEYLDHNTYTDIITFDYSEGKTISGDIFISIDRVRENALKFSGTFEQELHRVIIHGVLHLLGYTDKTKAAREEMRKQEDKCLKAFSAK